MYTTSSRVTALVTIAAGIVCLGMALWLIDDPGAYGARIYLRSSVSPSSSSACWSEIIELLFEREYRR